MSALHGAPSRGSDVPHGNNGPTGLFGRMFGTLEGRRPTGLKEAEKYGLPGGKMDGGATDKDQENPDVPAGFTFFGQFIDHNITFDALTRLGEQAAPNGLTDMRPPRLDMSNLYNAGPVVSSYLYDPASHQTKLALSTDGVDVPRMSPSVAVIGEPRNDENLLLNQLHVALIKFHNEVVDQLRAKKITTAFGDLLPDKPDNEPGTEQPGVPLDQLLDVDNYYDRVFAEAQRLVRWHYQWIVAHEFLRNFTDPHILEDVRTNGPRFFRPGGRPFIPVEFAVAAFRFGHPTVRSGYQVNDHFSGKIFPDDPDEKPPTRTKRTSLIGGAPVGPKFAVDWSYFFAVDQDRRPQRARKILASLNTQLLDLPVEAVPGAEHGALARPVASLAVRNLLRSEAQVLPSGQDVARKVGEVPLTDDQLDGKGPAYLWYYVLKEAEVLAGGRHLGPVGSRIVAEVLLGLLDADPASYRSVYPAWRPTLGDGDFGVVDLLRFAGVVPFGGQRE